jgi:hypothetical protein
MGIEQRVPTGKGDLCLYMLHLAEEGQVVEDFEGARKLQIRAHSVITMLAVQITGLGDMPLKGKN